MSYHYSFSYTWKSVFHSILNLFAEQVRMSVAQRVSTNPVHTVLLHREVLLHKADLRPLLLRSVHVRRPYTTSSRLKGFHHRRRMCPPPLPILFRQGVFRRFPAIAHAILQSAAHLRAASLPSRRESWLLRVVATPASYNVFALFITYEHPFLFCYFINILDRLLFDWVAWIRHKKKSVIPFYSTLPWRV